jgi:hypothetical protein
MPSSPSVLDDSTLRLPEMNGSQMEPGAALVDFWQLADQEQADLAKKFRISPRLGWISTESLVHQFWRFPDFPTCSGLSDSDYPNMEALGAGHVREFQISSSRNIPQEIVDQYSSSVSPVYLSF